MAKQLNALIIGAGQIGAFFDAPDSNNILTHAHAYTKSNNYKLIGFIDSDFKKAQKAANLWNCDSFSTIDEAFKKHSIDVISVAVPDAYHYEILSQVSNYPVRIVFAEKPLTKTITQAQEIEKIFKQKNVPVLVNYSRRFVPEFWEIQKNIQNNTYGKYITGTGYYGKGFLHNGSHMIDFLRYLLGEIETINILQKQYDYYTDDPSVSGIIYFANKTPFFLQHVNCSFYTLFELDLLFEKKRLRIKNSGFCLEEFDIKPNPIFKEYKNLTQISESQTQLGQALSYAVENMYNFLAHNEPLKCTINDGEKALELCSLENNS
ncbi:MAG: hypothetical protein C0412_13125 [Flavobacterium sp.]|nr:hypothetical protein [Flavobacterium sp.]